MSLGKRQCAELSCPTTASTLSGLMLQLVSKRPNYYATRHCEQSRVRFVTKHHLRCRRWWPSRLRVRRAYAIIASTNSTLRFTRMNEMYAQNGDSHDPPLEVQNMAL